MNTLIHADIFFFVTTIVVVILGIGGILATILVIRILIILRDIAEKVRKEGGLIAEDIAILRSRMRRGINMMAAINFFYSLFSRIRGPVDEEEE